MESKDVIPAVEPVIFVRYRASADRAEAGVFDVAIKFADAHEQRIISLDQLTRPRATDAPIILAGIDSDLLAGHRLSNAIGRSHDQDRTRSVLNDRI